jgi:hypothetical protein
MSITIILHLFKLQDCFEHATIFLLPLIFGKEVTNII